jgi:hypothetical protein
MHNYINSMLCSIMLFFTASTSAYAAETNLANEADYLCLAANAIVQAQKYDQSPELESALRAIRSVGVSFLDSANTSLKEAFKISPRTETKAALDQISEIGKSYLGDASKLLAAAVKVDVVNTKDLAAAQAVIDKVLNVTVSKNSNVQFKEDPVLEIILSLLAPILAACVALAVLIESGNPAGPGLKRSKKSAARPQFEEAITKLKHLSADFDVSDQEILELRNNARNLKMAT